MRKIYEQLKAALAQFVKQRDYLLLLVPCEDSDVAFLLKAMRDLDRESGSDLFLLFNEEFQAPDQFVNDVATRLYQEHTLTDSPELAPMPDEFLNATLPPADRL